MNITHGDYHLFPLPLPPLQAVATAVVTDVELLITMTIIGLVGTTTVLTLVTPLMHQRRRQCLHQHQRQRQCQRLRQHHYRHRLYSMNLSSLRSFLLVSMVNSVVAATFASDVGHCQLMHWHSATALVDSASTAHITVMKQRKAVCVISAVAFTFTFRSITLMQIDATAIATVATVAVNASAFFMTTSHGLITKQTMVRILTPSSLLFNGTTSPRRLTQLKRR